MSQARGPPTPNAYPQRIIQESKWLSGLRQNVRRTTFLRAQENGEKTDKSPGDSLGVRTPLTFHASLLCKQAFPASQSASRRRSWRTAAVRTSGTARPTLQSGTSPARSPRLPLVGRARPPPQLPPCPPISCHRRRAPPPVPRFVLVCRRLSCARRLCRVGVVCAPAP